MSSSLVLLNAPSSTRPVPVRQKPLPPFEASDDQGLVHTTQPPDLVIPSWPDRHFWRGDIGGVTLKETPPFVPGANTTPPEMTMSFLLPWYSREWQDKILTAHAERGYTHFHLDLWNARKAGYTPEAFADLVDYVRSWGFFVSCWLTSNQDDRSQGWASVSWIIAPYLSVILDRPKPETFISMPGQELNNGCPPGPNGADSIISHVCAMANPVDSPVWLHFTEYYPGYPENVPPAQADMAMVQWIARWRGRVRGLAWQGDSGGSAGLMGAKLWDARRFWARAGFTDYPCVSAFELMASFQLYGKATEEYGCLRGLEMVYCTSDGSAPPVAGFGNGARLPNGDPL